MVSEGVGLPYDIGRIVVNGNKKWSYSELIDKEAIRFITFTIGMW